MKVKQMESNSTNTRQQLNRLRAYVQYFDVLLNVHLSIFISVINQLDKQNLCFTISLFHACSCFEHYVLIIRRSKLYYTASGINTPIGMMIPDDEHMVLETCIGMK